MATESERESTPATQQEHGHGSGVGLALALAALAAVGTGIALQQLLERRLSRPERARLKFYRYLHERGRLES